MSRSLYSIFQKILLFFGVLSFALFLLLLGFQLYLYNNFFYDWQYEKNEVYTRFGSNETWTATHELRAYLHYRGSFSSGFFSERDQEHMVDVRNIISFLTTLFFISGLLVLFFLFFIPFFLKQSFRSFFSSFCLRTSALLFLFLGFFFCAVLFFDTTFLWFHYLVFSNDFWLLDPAVDRLIVLYPESFFFTIFLFILLTVLVFAIVLFFGGRFLRSQKPV